MRADDCDVEAIRQDRAKLIELLERSEASFLSMRQVAESIISQAVGRDREQAVAYLEAATKQHIQSRARAMLAIANSRRWEP